MTRKEKNHRSSLPTDTKCTCGIIVNDYRLNLGIFAVKKSTYEVIISSRQHARVKFIRCPVSQPTERLLTLDKYSDSLQYCRPNLMILMKFEGFERNIQRFRALL